MAPGGGRGGGHLRGRPGPGGTLSGEHGIGKAKSRFLEKEVGPGTIYYSKRIKAALDPKNILNPGQSIGE